MSDSLANLTQADIRTRCTAESFKRGQSYYSSGAITKRIQQGETKIEAWVSGTEVYRVSVWIDAGGQLDVYCTCPYAYGGDCKHIVATLLAWVNAPDSFQPPLDLKTILQKRSKAELVQLLLDANAIYPDLADDLNLEQKKISLTDPESVVGEVFEAMELHGALTVEQVRARLNVIARQADQLAKQGKGDLARRAYYEMVVNCVRLFGPYGHELISPYAIPYDFATAYVELALQQLDQHQAAIEVEVKEMYNSEYVYDMFDLMEALVEIEEALGWSVEA